MFADSCSDSTVAPSATCSVNVKFTPSTTSGELANLTFTTNAANSPETVPLTGTGTAPAAPVFSPSPATLAFGNQNVGTKSAAMTVTVTNTGNANLTISSDRIGGANAADFAISADSCSDSTVAPSATCSVSATFTPSISGAETAALNFTDNAAGSPQAVSLTGTGVAPSPSVSLTLTSLTFPVQDVGTSSTAQSVTLTNTGSGTLTISSIAIQGTNAASFSQTNTCGASVNAGASCVITVTFKPTGAGSNVATLMITDNATGSPQSVGLAGTAVDFSLSATPTSATVKAGSSTSFTITVAPGTGGFPSAVTLAASGLPTAATGTLTPTSVTPGNAAATSTLMITTTTNNTARTIPPYLPGSGRWPRAPIVAVWLAGLLLVSLSRAWLKAASKHQLVRLAGVALLLVFLVGVAGFASGCNGGYPGFNVGTPAETYTITVTGTSGSLTHATSVTLTVQ